MVYESFGDIYGEGSGWSSVVLLTTLLDT
jgi:hypothetical protein